MRTLIRGALAFALMALTWPELASYRGERLLADARARLSDALNGTTRGDAALASVQTALAEAQLAAACLPADQRPALSASIALLLLHRGTEAAAILTAAIAEGERPELTVNLGRARGILGDESGAQAAFLRTAWASPPSVATLPSAIREPVLERVKSLEDELRAGRLRQIPPL